VKADGSPITARGLKLMAHGALIEGGTERTQQDILKPEPVGPKPQPKQPHSRHSALRIAPGTSDRWNHLLSDRFPDHPNQAARMMALLDWLEQHPEQEQTEPSLQSRPQPEPDLEATAQPQPMITQPADFTALQETLNTLMARLDQLEQQQKMQASPLAALPQPLIQPPTQVAESTPRPYFSTPPRSHKATDRAYAIFQAVQAWNQQYPQQSFAITLGLLKDEFGINFKAARSFLEIHQTEISELHQRSGVENPRSHNRQMGRNIEELKRFVQSANSSG
jgi:hypothetical protein